MSLIIWPNWRPNLMTTLFLPYFIRCQKLNAYLNEILQTSEQFLKMQKWLCSIFGAKPWNSKLTKFLNAMKFLIFILLKPHKNIQEK